MTDKELRELAKQKWWDNTYSSGGMSAQGNFVQGYIECYKDTEKQIEKLESQIEKMKCCENCKHSDTECEGYIVCSIGHYDDCRSNRQFDNQNEEDYWEM